MVRPRHRAALLLTLSLLLPSVASAEGFTAPRPSGLLAVWDLIGELWAPIVGLFEKEGSSIDPLGTPAPPPQGTGGTTGTSGVEAIPTVPKD